MNNNSLVQVTQNIPDVKKVIDLIYKKYSDTKADMIINNLISKNIIGLELLKQYKNNNFNIEKMLKSLNI